MRRRVVALVLAWTTLVLGTVGAWGDEDETRPAPKLGISAPAIPCLSLGVNGLSDGVGLQGRKLLLELAVDRTRGHGESGDLVIANPSGAWSDLVHIEIRDAAGQVVPGARVTIAEKTGSTLTLAEDTEASLTFAVENALPPGEYRVVGILDWNGRIASPPSRLTIKPAAAALEGEDEETVALTEIRLQALFGTPDSTLAAVDRWLEREPGSTYLLEAKGDVLSLAGRYREAVAVYDSTLELVPPQPESEFREAPVGLIWKRNAVEARTR